MEAVNNAKFLFIICVNLVLLLPTSRSAITFANETDRFALLAFKDRITGDPFGALSSWNTSSHHCSWTGITCSRRHPSRVTVLNLVGRSLVGSISPHIGNLTFLQNLSLSTNSFHGEIPQEIGRLSRLRFLYLTNNSLQGEIPNNITSCTQLRLFFAPANELTGRIPTQIGWLTKLVALELTSNYLDGSIPVSLSNISTLVAVSLIYNNLYGNIPPEMSKLSRLLIFQVSMNNLSGIVPHQVFNISSLSQFAVAGNRLSGTIPPSIGFTLPNLQGLFIGGNMFSGLLPNSITNCSSLFKLDVSYNQFTGHIPPNLGSLQGLVILHLGGNQFGTGEADTDLSFFDSLSNCSLLEFLLVHTNNLTGQLPDSIANLSTKLTELSIGENHIYGEIPAGIENLVSLEALLMQNNLLSGSIPVSIGKLPNLVRVYMSRNQLSGQIPSNICNSTGLENIFLNGNRLQGQIPQSLGDCRNLRVLNLSENQLTGPIPKKLVGLSSLLIWLDLSWNNLTGNFPSEVGNLEKITVIDISHNQLSGEIPSSLEKCLGLGYLNLQGNFFEGIIPPSLRSLKGIRHLDLSSNRLSGRIPEFLQSFVSLEYLNLSYNEFEGEVSTHGIFKNLSAFSILGNSKLCGGIPLLNLSSCTSPGSKKQSKVQFPTKRLLLIVFGAVVFVIFLGSVLIFFCKRKTTKKSSLLITQTPSDKMFQVSFRELYKATNGFSVENLVGVGSYGSVYKGALVLSQGVSTVVAVKVFDLERRGASKSFIAECEALRCIRHRNLLKIMTSCSSIDFKGNEFKALVFEFMPNGSLDDWLHPTTNDTQLPWSRGRPLSFMERLSIATDSAFALEYLHHHCQTPVVHCDLKPSNVLLDDKMNAHVGDFGLAKFLGGVIINDSTSIGLRGSIGYAAPEYGMGSEVSTNGDVYSYGILLLEMFTGRRPTDDMFADGLNLHSFGNMALVTNRVLQIVDPIMLLAPLNFQESTINCEIEVNMAEALIRIVQLGVRCSTNAPEDRMDMVQVVKELRSIKNI